MQSIQIIVITIITIVSLATLNIVYVNFAQETGDKALPAAKGASDIAGSKSIKVIEMYVEDGSDQNPGSVNYLFMKTKLSPGSGPIKLDSLLMEIHIDGLGLQEYTYNSSINCTEKNLSSLDSLGNASSGFGITYLLRGGEGRPNTLVQGDLTLFCLNFQNTLGINQKFRVTILPNGGSVFTTNLELPENLKTNRISIYKRA